MHTRTAQAVAAIIAGLFATSLSYPLKGYDVSNIDVYKYNHLAERVTPPPPTAPRPKRPLDPDEIDTSAPDGKRPQTGTGSSSGSGSGQSGVVGGSRTWGGFPEPQPAPAPVAGPAVPPGGAPRGGTVGTIPIADLPPVGAPDVVPGPAVPPGGAPRGGMVGTIPNPDLAAPPGAAPEGFSIQSLQNSGRTRIIAMNNAVNGVTPPRDHGFNQFFNGFYTMRSRPVDPTRSPSRTPQTPESDESLPQNAVAGVPDMPPEAARYLRANNIKLDDPDVKLVDIWGKKVSNDDIAAHYDRTAFSAYVSPNGQWMMITRMFRNDRQKPADTDSYYAPVAQLPRERRLPMSELVNHVWAEMGGGKKLKTLGAANVEADDTQVFFQYLTQSGREQGVITPADRDWEPAMGSSSGSVGANTFTDHHSESIFLNQGPSQVQWRYTGIKYPADDPKELDAWYTVHFGDSPPPGPAP